MRDFIRLAGGRGRKGLSVLLLLALHGSAPASPNPSCQPLFELQEGNVPLVINTAAALREREAQSATANTVLGFSPRGFDFGGAAGGQQGEVRPDDEVAIGTLGFVHERDSLRVPVSLGTHAITAYRIRILLLLPGTAGTDAVYHEDRHIIDHLEDDGFGSRGVVALCGSRRDAFEVPSERDGLIAYMNVPSDISGSFDVVVAVYDDNGRIDDSLLAMRTTHISLPPHVGPGLGNAPWMYLSGIPVATPAVLCDEAFGLTDGSQICSAKHVRALPTCLVVSVRSERWWGKRPQPHASATGGNRLAENGINFSFESAIHTLNPLCDIHLFLAQGTADATQDLEGMRQPVPPYVHVHNTAPSLWEQIYKVISDIRGKTAAAAQQQAPPTFIEILRIDCGGCEGGQQAEGGGPGRVDGLARILGMSIGQVLVRCPEASIDVVGSGSSWFLRTMRAHGYLMFHSAVSGSQASYSASSFSASSSSYTVCSNYSSDRRAAVGFSFVKLQMPPPTAADPPREPSSDSGPDDALMCLAHTWPHVQVHVRAVHGFEVGLIACEGCFLGRVSCITALTCGAA